MPPSATLSSPPSAGISTQPLTQARRLPQARPPSEAHPHTPPTAAHSSPEHAPVDPISQFRPRVPFPGPVHPVYLFRPGVPRHVPWRHALSLVVPAGTVFIHPVLSCPWRLVWGRRLPLLWPRRPFPATCPSCRWNGSCFWGTLWGPLTSHHAQYGPQLPSLAQGLPVPVGSPVPVFSPREPWYPLNYPMDCFFWGGLGFCYGLPAPDVLQSAQPRFSVVLLRPGLRLRGGGSY